MPVLLVGLLLACPRAVQPQAAATSGGPLFEVGTVTLFRDDAGRCVFDDQRPYVVSVHRDFEATPLVEELAAGLPGIGLEHDVVLDWFGDTPQERIEVLLGRDLDTALAGLLVDLVAAHAAVPVAVSALQEEGETCSRSRAYLGSLVSTDLPALSPEELEALAGAAADPAAFWELVPPSGR